MPATFDDAFKRVNRQIDALVHELYALTAAEIKIVEGAQHHHA
jgi:hypothetical protein